LQIEGVVVNIFSASTHDPCFPQLGLYYLSPAPHSKISSCNRSTTLENYDSDQIKDNAIFIVLSY